MIQREVLLVFKPNLSLYCHWSQGGSQALWHAILSCEVRKYTANTCNSGDKLIVFFYSEHQSFVKIK